jgi:hypothetical protein
MPEEAGPGGQEFSGADFRRRLPSVFRQVSGIRPGDIRVSVIGTVIDKAEDGIVLDDGSGKIDITMAEPFEAELNGLVRVFGRVIPMEGGFQLQGEIVQDMKGLDLELLKKVESLEGHVTK